MKAAPGSMQTVRLLRQFSGRRLLRFSAASLLLCCSPLLSSFSRALAALCLSRSSFLSLAVCLSASISSLVRRFRAGLGVPRPAGLGGDKAGVWPDSLFVADDGAVLHLSSELRSSVKTVLTVAIGLLLGLVSQSLSSDSDTSHVWALRSTDISYF